MNPKSYLRPFAGLLAAGVLGALFLHVGKHHAAPEETGVLDSVKSQPGDRPHALAVERESTRVSESGLHAALAETDPARRRELFRRWADSLAVGTLAEFLANIESMTDADNRAEVRQAVLTSWSRRDLAGMAGWFGTRAAADEMHQEARELLARALVGRGPAVGFTWMEKSLPESVRQELYGSYFRQWTATDPAEAAAKLRQLAEASPETPVWSDLLGQVIAQWAGADIKSAVAWTQALPDGPDKSRALVQLSERWVQSDPHAAAMYASVQNAPGLLNTVVARWAELDPRQASAWANALPAGAERNAALVSAAATWAQKDPKAAAGYVGGLSTPDAKTQAELAVGAVWTNADPAAAAKWVEQFPEGTVRELALEQLVATWATRSTGAAGEWLKSLPDTRSRDVAVAAYCAALEGADPVASFEWAKTISDKTIREQRIEGSAISWIEKHPEPGDQN